MFLNGDIISLQLHHCFLQEFKACGKKNQRFYCQVDLISEQSQPIVLSKPFKISMCPITIVDDVLGDGQEITSFSVNSTLTFNLSHVYNSHPLSIRILIMESKFIKKDTLLGCGYIQIPNNLIPNMETVLSTTLTMKDQVGTIYSGLTLLRRCVSGSFPVVSPYKSINVMDTRRKTMNMTNEVGSQSISINNSLNRIHTSSHSIVEIADEESGIVFNISGNYVKCIQEFVQSNQFCDSISTFLFKNIQLRDRNGQFMDMELDQIKLQMFFDCEQSLEHSNRMLIHKMIQQDQVGAFLNFENSETRSSFGYPLAPNFVEISKNRRVDKLNDYQALSNEWIFFNQSLNRLVKVEVLSLFMNEDNILILLEHRTTVEESNNYSNASNTPSIIEEIASSIYLLGTHHKRSTIDNSFPDIEGSLEY